MKIIMYGAEICPNCVDAHEVLKNQNEVQYEYRNITHSTSLLKEFLAYRDKESIFDEVKAAGRIGIPFFVLEDGRKTFDMEEFMKVPDRETDDAVVACSIDGKGNC